MEIESKAFWLDISEYSRIKEISISTIRRQIKLNKVKFKLEDGKYFIFSEDTAAANDFHLHELEKIKKENIKLKEEIEELKMLIMIYEKKVKTN
ncbi:MAG: hypothetical protein U0T83_05205 [Bacteriovoracaceae bacterium]